MDPLSDYTALSPYANAPSLASRLDDSEEVTSQQCSADPSAFACLQRPLGVVSTSSAASFPRAGGALRLSLDVGGGGVSQMSQPGSQFHDALLQDTQNDEDALSVPEKKHDDNPTPAPTAKPKPRNYQGGGGLLSSLERRMHTNGTRRVDRSYAAVEILSSDEEEDAMDKNTPGDGEQREDTSEDRQTGEEIRRSVVVNPVVSGTDENAESDTEGEHDTAFKSDTESEECYRRDSMDSLPETQPFDEYEQHTAASSENALPSTQAFADTMDEEELTAVSSVATRDADREPAAFSTKDRENELTVTSSAERKSQFLKRKQINKETLDQDPETFANTEDQTLAELVNRIRRERETKIQAVRSLTYLEQPHSAHYIVSQDETQEEFTPTQPSKASPEAVVHVAFKKRGKANQPSAAELSAAQEKSYEFVDSACQCGETICACAADTTPAKATARPSSAMRNLEFSFATPESQDSESQSMDSLPDVSSLAMKTLEAAQATKQQQQPKAPSSVIPSSPSRGEKRHELDEVEATPKKTKKTRKECSPSSVAGTPPTSRKRGRTFLSPDAGANLYSKEVTPRKSSRHDKPPIAPTSTSGSSKQSVRTRTKILSPVPTATSRSYSSRFKSLFNNARHFCLTGFTGEGLDNLKKLIEDYGGKVCQQNVLLKENNSKVVVIATPISWRKLKFMCAIACGIPVVHPEWIHGCIKARSVIPFDGYCVPSGSSILTGKFECHPVRELDIFKGLRFGIPYDASPLQLESTKEMSSLIAFILRECGAEAIEEDLKPTNDNSVDIVLADEYTKTCEYHVKKHRSGVRTFAWVTECVILQRLLEPDEVDFTPRLPRGLESGQRCDLTVSSATIPIGDGVQLRLHNGELLLVDLSAEGAIDHFLLFDVCEILSIRVTGDARTGSKRKQSGKSIKLQVGVLERRPNSPALRRTHTRIIDLSPDNVKRRVVAVSKADFDAMKYRDETIFYYEDE